MKRTRSAFALIAVATFFGVSGIALAGTPTQADFDACNREAQMSVQNPSASPGSGGTITDTSGTSNTTRSGSTSSVPESRGSSVGGPVASGSTGSSSGTTSGESTVSHPGATTPGSSTMSRDTTVSAGANGPGSTGTSVGGPLASGTTSSDSTLIGMAAAGINDQAYQQAYRDCLRRRGF